VAARQCRRGGLAAVGCSQWWISLQTHWRVRSCLPGWVVAHSPCLWAGQAASPAATPAVPMCAPVVFCLAHLPRPDFTRETQLS
jgi:hypothetical protein